MRRIFSILILELVFIGKTVNRISRNKTFLSLLLAKSTKLINIYIN